MRGRRWSLQRDRGFHGVLRKTCVPQQDKRRVQALREFGKHLSHRFRRHIRNDACRLLVEVRFLVHEHRRYCTPHYGSPFLLTRMCGFAQSAVAHAARNPDLAGPVYPNAEWFAGSTQIDLSRAQRSCGGRSGPVPALRTFARSLCRNATGADDQAGASVPAGDAHWRPQGARLLSLARKGRSSSEQKRPGRR